MFYISQPGLSALCLIPLPGQGMEAGPLQPKPRQGSVSAARGLWAVWGRAGLRGVAAVPLSTLHSCPTAAGARGPGAPGAPAAGDGLGPVAHGHTLAIEAPLQGQRGEHSVRDGQNWGPAHGLGPANPCCAAWARLGSARAWSNGKLRGVGGFGGGNKPKAPRQPLSKGTHSPVPAQRGQSCLPSSGEHPREEHPARQNQPCALLPCWVSPSG